MNKLNKIFSVVVFVFFLLSTVFITKSYAEWTEVPNSTKSSSTYTDTSDTIAGYTLYQIRSYFTSTDKESRNTMLEEVSNAGYYVAWLPYNSSNSYTTFVYSKNNPIDIGAEVSAGNFVFRPFINEGIEFYRYTSGTSGTLKKGVCNTSGYYSLTNTPSFNKSTFDSMIAEDNNAFGSIPYIKTLLSNSGYYWNGEYYFYRNTIPDEPDEPTFPTNQEIVDVVQKFYNSDIYKNNDKFKDFLVIYYIHNNTFAFIGHTIGNDLEQVIVPPNVREQGKLYGEQWWHFKVNENAGATPYGTTFYLYTTTDYGEIFQDDGTGTISGLVNIDFSNNSVIVYSNYDYTVQTYKLDETTGDISYTEGVIKGDQYTYDENLNPTENYYNPLDNFVTVNPADTIVDSADFSFIYEKFEEFKDLFVFGEDMQWLISANNKLSNYFIGFIVMCALFFGISRLLKG